MRRSLSVFVLPARRKHYLRQWALLLDQEFFTVETGDPARRLTAARPCAAAVGVTVFRRNASARTAGFSSSALRCAAAAEFAQRNAVVGHFLLDFIQHFRVFTRLRF